MMSPKTAVPLFTKSTLITPQEEAALFHPMNSTGFWHSPPVNFDTN